MQNLTHFNELFGSVTFTDDFGWSSEWNAEIEKWLAFIKSKNNDYYESNKNRLKTDKQRDELLGEYKAAYFIEKKLKLPIIEFEPDGHKGRRVDFSFKDLDGEIWFAEVKSPSWRNVVAKEVESEYLRRLRGDGVRMKVDAIKNSQPARYKYIATITCPNCRNDIETEIKLRGELDDEVLKKIVCGKCKNNIWRISEKERAKKIEQRLAKPQFISGEGRWFDGSEAIEDAIVKSVKQFAQKRNNLLVITANMFAVSGLMAAMDEGYKVRQLLEKHDTDRRIACILILEVSLPFGGFKYTSVFVPATDKEPNHKSS